MHCFRDRTHKLVNAARNLINETSDSEISNSGSGSDYVCSSASDNESDDENYLSKLKGTFISAASPARSEVFENQELNDENSPGMSPEMLLNISGAENITKKTRRKHNCLYCDITVHNFARHLTRQHSDELQVQKFLDLKKNDPMRKQIINQIRKEGDFSTGTAVPVQQKQSQIIDSNCKLLPCTHCKGYYAKNTLRRHVRRCAFNKSRNILGRKHHQSDGHTLMANHFGPNDILRTSRVLETLKADEISLVAKRDKIICEIARKYIRSHKEKHLVMVARRQMRRLARLLIEARTIEKNRNLSLLCILNPSKFKVLIQATRSISAYNCNNQSFNSPSLALQMGTLIKKAISVAYSMEVQSDINSTKLNTLNILKKLIDDEWATEVSTEAGQNLLLNRFNKPSIIPMSQDLAKMKNYLENLISNSKIKLQTDTKDEMAYKSLIEGTYCNLLLFNKRRVGELQRILLETYTKNQNNKPSEEFERVLTPSEKILINKLKRIVVRGKHGRGVPVLFDKATQEGIDIVIRHRNKFFESYNPYLFGLVHSDSCISGYHVFRKHVISALGDPRKATSLTSTKLRKHLATICQILNMGREDIDQLATFMGHSTKTHNEWYKLPSDVYQTAKVSKILLLSQTNNIDIYKGRNLNEIDVGDELLEMQNDSESEDIRDGASLVNSNKEETVSQKNSNKKRKIIRKAWSDEEKKVTQEYFKKHIKKKIPPKKEEVLKLMALHTDLFKDRKWDVIKAFVFNQYSK